ncbi:MAG: hypothetical protein LBR52_04430 [Prevotellaceae bacterium]|nr:hypothetical protein [Prevotellaceae bacterium]
MPAFYRKSGICRRIFNDGFESATTGRKGREAASAAISTEQTHAGGHALFISGRTAARNGAGIAKDSLTACGTYTIDGYVLYNNNSD